MHKCTSQKIKNNYSKLINSFIKICKFELGSNEHTVYESIKNGYWSDDFVKCGAGEAAAMALGHLNQGIVAGNNIADINEYIKKLDFELITFSMILSKA